MVLMNKDRLQWFREARFGMFIHWGLYALPAGSWKGKDTPWVGEWIMRKFKIPPGEYEKLADQFNPVDFNAKTWVKIAKNAGMKYIVITSKHHDGFAMYDSKVSDYNIVRRTPYARDPLKDLAEACEKEDIKLGFYYSHDQDWYAKGGSGQKETPMNAADKRRFSAYLKNQVKPQISELLTNYGPIAIIWFDTPNTITAKQSEDLKDFVHNIQPECLVSGRIGHSLGDYQCLGDNRIPEAVLKVDSEMLGTMNDSWGYKNFDQNWKSAEYLIKLLVIAASRNANYLLNIGPTAKGVIPTPCIRTLKKIGEWLRVNGDSIYGTRPENYTNDRVHDLHMTAKLNRLFLHFFSWQGKAFRLYGVRNKIKKCFPLTDKSTNIIFRESHDQSMDYHAVELDLPRHKPDKYVSVIEIQTKGELDINRNAYSAR